MRKYIQYYYNLLAPLVYKYKLVMRPLISTNSFGLHFLLHRTGFFLGLPLSLLRFFLPLPLLGLLLLFNLVVFSFDESDKSIAPSLELHGRSALDEPVKSELRS